MVSERPVRIATRGSALARWQAEYVAGLLGATGSVGPVELVIVDTVADRTLDRPIWELGGQGVFVKEVQAAVLDDRADLAVHSAKDLPSAPSLATPGQVIAAVPERGNAGDALVGQALANLVPGSVVATGSTRRRAQLADRRPDLTFTGLRGNIDTRLARVGEVGAIVVAAAALERLGRLAEAAEVLTPADMVPQVGQGAMAIECRSDDEALRARLATIEHQPTRHCVDAERAYLACLGGGCELPVGAYAVTGDDGGLYLRAVLCTLDGRQVLREQVRAGPQTDPVEVGTTLGQRLMDTGGRALLADLGVGPARSA